MLGQKGAMVPTANQLDQTVASVAPPRASTCAPRKARRMRSGRVTGVRSPAGGRAAAGYADLEAEARRLAHLLRPAGVGRGAPVETLGEPSLDMMVAIFGVLRPGSHYLALDDIASATWLPPASPSQPRVLAPLNQLPSRSPPPWRSELSRARTSSSSPAVSPLVFPRS